MKKIISFFLLLFAVSSFSCFGQESKKEKLSIEQKIEKLKGTFQIQVKDSRQKASVPYNIDEIIKSNQKEDEVAYVPLGTMVRIMILPKKELQAKRNLELFSTY